MEELYYGISEMSFELVLNFCIPTCRGDQAGRPTGIGAGVDYFVGTRCSVSLRMVLK